MASQSASEHRSQADGSIRCAIITVSDTRTIETDRGGQTIVDFLTDSPHQVVGREIIPDEPQKISDAIRTQASLAQAILLTGGTGISNRDQTYETVVALFDKEIPGYGELFRMLSYEEIGAAAMLSRATAGIMGQVVIVTMPGSTAAVKLAMQKLILPELAHLVFEATK